MAIGIDKMEPSIHILMRYSLLADLASFIYKIRQDINYNNGKQSETKQYHKHERCKAFSILRISIRKDWLNN